MNIRTTKTTTTATAMFRVRPICSSLTHLTNVTHEADLLLVPHLTAPAVERKDNAAAEGQEEGTTY